MVGTSAQKSELIALAEALEWVKRKRATIYTDSRYAFGTVHIHGAIYRERGFITADGGKVRNLPEIQRLLAAVQKPQAIAVVHVSSHQTTRTPEATGNKRADEAAKQAAIKSVAPTLTLNLPMPEPPGLPACPDYSSGDHEWMQRNNCTPPDPTG